MPATRLSEEVGQRPGPGHLGDSPVGAPRLGRSRAGLAFGGLTIVLGVLAIVHLTQGVADVGLGDLVAWLGGRAEGRVADVVLASRLPRLVAAVVVGSALGGAGAAFQAITRNPLASPDTLAVNAGAHLTLTLVAAFGIPLGTLGGTGTAFVGGLLGAVLVLTLTRGDSSPARLVLVGSVVAMGLAAVTSALMLIFAEETAGLFAWGSGSLSQAGTRAVVDASGVLVVAAAALALLARRLDLLQLGDDAARSLGMGVARVRVATVVVAVLLSAAAVTLAGPIGFVGLCAPVVVRLLASVAPRLATHRWLLPGSALAGASIVLVADVALRWLIGAESAVEVPSGVVTTLLGAATLIALSAGLRTGRTDASPALIASSMGWARRHPLPLLVVLAVLAGTGALSALLVGDGMLRLGDVGYWLQGVASGRITFVLDTRLPRVLAALVAGAALALSGMLTQAAVRNPLADPGILGVSAGAGTGAMSAVLLAPATGFTGMAVGALVGASAAAGIVFGLTARTGFEPTRVVLVGVGVAAACAATTTVLVLRSNPYNQTLAITWLGGSTYGATLPDVGWVTLVLVAAAVVTALTHRDLDVLQLDSDTPVLLGVRLGRSRTLALVTAVVLSAAATVGVGVIGFVGLVAPHAARLLVGARHRWLAPLSVLIGALVVLVADSLGRSALAPAQLPVGLVCALIGAPFFLWLMARMRA